MNPLTCCPRCGHQNASPARFCANCGLNLAAIGNASSGERPLVPNRRRKWVVLGVLVAALLLGAVLARRGTCPLRRVLAPQGQFQSHGH